MFPRCEGVRWDTVRMLPSMQTGHSLTQGNAIGVGKDLMPTICKAAQQRVADQTFPMRLVIRQALGGAVDEDVKTRLLLFQRVLLLAVERQHIIAEHFINALQCFRTGLVAGKTMLLEQGDPVRSGLFIKVPLATLTGMSSREYDTVGVVGEGFHQVVHELRVDVFDNFQTPDQFKFAVEVQLLIQVE